MRSVVVIAFYIWLAVSVAMLFARLAKRLSSKGEPAAERSSPTEPGSASSEPSEPGSAPEPATTITTSPPTQGTPAAARTVGGSSAAGASTQRVAAPPDRTLAELLAGINVPNDLVPIVPEGGGIDPTTASLITDAPAAEVGKGVADELERLGFELKVLGATDMVARRGDDLLSVSLVLAPHEPDETGQRRFPTAKQGDVVVDFWVGGGPRPTT